MLTAIQRLAGWRGRCLLFAAFAVSATGGFPTSALAASPTKWAVTMTHANAYGQQAGACPGGKAQTEPPCGIDPLTEGKGDEGEGGKGETFARESGWNEYKITVTNTGETSSVGPVTVVDHLPVGFVLHAGSENEEASGTGWSGGREPAACKILPDAVGVECTNKESLPSGKSFSPITLHVNVMPEAENPSTNVATVSGGGAVPESASTTKEEGETKVTKAVPFGVASFTTNIFKEPTEPLTEPLSEAFSQAGGHPFAVSNEIVFNYTPSANRGQLVPAGGAAKEVQGETPTGFTGNTLNAPQCPGALLAGNLCPANTAVGYVHIALANTSSGGVIVGGKVVAIPESLTKFSTSLIYNMQPGPGAPAVFGFVVAEGVPFVLEAKLRSDGDYGVTVGDNAAGNGGEKQQAVKLTFCENGVEAKGSPDFHCNPAPASSEPFLTNPTACSGSAPSWTLLANPWHEPVDYQSKTVACEPRGGRIEREIVRDGLRLPPVSSGNRKQAEPALRRWHHPGGRANWHDARSEGAADQQGRTARDTGAQERRRDATGGDDALAVRGRRAAIMQQRAVRPRDGIRARIETQRTGQARLVPLGLADRDRRSLHAAAERGADDRRHAGPTWRAGELTCVQGTWNGSPTLSYQWLRNGAPIAGATDRQYHPVPAEDEGRALQCQVTATNAGGQLCRSEPGRRGLARIRNRPRCRRSRRRASRRRAGRRRWATR